MRLSLMFAAFILMFVYCSATGGGADAISA